MVAYLILFFKVFITYPMLCFIRFHVSSRSALVCKRVWFCVHQQMLYETERLELEVLNNKDNKNN
jgi:hypothetical protein